VERIMLYF